MELKSLQEASTADLLDELAERHNSVVFIGTKVEEFGIGGYWWKTKGQRYELLGLVDEVDILIRQETR